MTAATKLQDHGEIIKAALTDPAQVLRALGLWERAKRRGLGYVICCPWHDEHTPSCSVTVGDFGTLRVHCFGGCGTHDVLDLIAVTHRLDLRGADYQRVLLLGAQLAGLSLDFGPVGVVGAGPVATAPPPRSAPVRPVRPALDAVGAAVGALLDLSPIVGSVGVGLATRGLLTEAQADGWGELPADITSTPGDGFDVVDLAATEAAAALRAGPHAATLAPLLGPSGFRYPAHRLLIPWRTPDGKVWMLQRRYAPIYGDEQAESGGKYREEIRADVDAMPYGIERFHPDAAEVWLVEGAADVLAVRALARAGRLNPGVSFAVLGLPGVSAWERCKAAILPLLAGRVVVVATDTDKAGEAAVKAIGDDAWRQGARDVVRECVTDGAKDWCEVTRTLWTQGELP